jgi:hypothetical protein
MRTPPPLCSAFTAVVSNTISCIAAGFGLIVALDPLDPCPMMLVPFSVIPWLPPP